MFEINDVVDIKNTNLSGIIKRKNITNKGTFYTIATFPSNILVTSTESNLVYSNKTNKNKDKKVTLNVTIDEDFDESEIMLRHQAVEVAIENLDRFISKCICSKKKRIRIIHGRHGGILRKAVAEYLKNSPFVESYNLADYYEGSYGVTIANLK